MRHDVAGSRDSSDGIATCYGLGGPGIESRCGARFSAPVQTGSEANLASYTMGTGSLPGVKRPERGVGFILQSFNYIVIIYNYISDCKLTPRRLMSYIYIYMEHTFLMFLDHTQRHSTVSRTPLDE